MVYAANIVTVAEMQLMAGAGVGASDVDANHIILQDHAEAYLSNLLKTNLSGTGFTDLDVTTRQLISEWAARYAGMTMIQNDMKATYTTRVEAEDMINIHVFRMDKIEKLLLLNGVKPFLKT